MSISRVDKYGVPISGSTDERMPLSQPKFVNRFRLFLVDFGMTNEAAMREQGDTISNNNRQDRINANIVTSMTESFNRPTLSFGTQEATSFIGRSRYSGRLRHETFSFVLRDDINNAVISKLYAQAKKQVYKFHPITSNMIKSPYMGINTKFTCVLQLMDGKTNHKSLETWTFSGCVIDNIETTPSTYEDGANIVKLTVTCAFDSMNISQEARLILPSNMMYDSGLGDSDLEAPTDRRFLEELSNIGQDVSGRSQTLVNTARERVSGFFSGSNDSTINRVTGVNTRPPGGIG